MIIIIESEVKYLTDTLAGEVVNIVFGKEYYVDGVLRDNIETAPEYPMYTVDNKTVSVAADGVVIHVCSGDAYSGSVYDLRDAIAARLPIKLTDLTNRHGSHLPRTKVANFATTASTTIHESKNIQVNVTGRCPTRFYTGQSREGEWFGTLTSIYVVPKANMIRCPHRSCITDVRQDLLPAYDDALAMKSKLTILTSPRAQLACAFSDFYRSHNKHAFGAQDVIPVLLKDLNDDYLHPVEHWPADSDIPEYRTDLCTQCKSRLYDYNYAVYSHRTGVLCAFCPLCFHTSPLLRYAEFATASVYVFKHTRSALDMFEHYKHNYLPNEHQFMRDLATYGYADGRVRTPTIEYAVYHGDEIVSDIRNIDAKSVYGKSINVVKIDKK